MVICYRCGERTGGDYCQWYRFSMVWGIQARHRKADKLAKKEAEIASREQALREAGKQAEQEAELAAKQLAEREAELAAKQRAEREAEEAQIVREAEKQARQEAELAAKQQAERDAEEPQKVAAGTGSGIYQGDFKLVVSSPVGFERVREFRESLERIENLKILWTGGGADKGTIIAVSLQNPMPLIPILNKIQVVEKAEKMGGSILVMLKASPGS